jgi:hypothetical protein
MKAFINDLKKEETIDGENTMTSLNGCPFGFSYVIDFSILWIPFDCLF